MKKPFDLTDSYVRRARLQPAMLVAFPVAVATLAWTPGGLLGWSALWSLFVWCGGTALLAQLARDRGKRMEPELFRSWGGKPTTRFLRHRDAPNRIILSRRHKKLQRLVSGVQIPTAAEEASNPEAADEVYEACTSYLLERTRKKDDFPLVFEENCNYGFRRNLWGMKPLGISTSLIGVVAIAALFLWKFRTGLMPGPLVFFCAALDVAVLLGWLVWFTPHWVKIPGDAYAERLLSACEGL